MMPVLRTRCKTHRLFALCLGALPVLASGQTTSEVSNLLRSKNCMACHQLEKRMIGPPFAAIAQRFKGEAAVAALLSRRIREGSRWQWGALAMPRQDNVSEAEADQLAVWILSLWPKAAPAPVALEEK